MSLLSQLGLVTKEPFVTSAPLYTFLSYCNESPLPKEILDCGAGGSPPPLALFHQQGYETHGIEISTEQLEKARRFCVARGLDLDIAQGDMRRLPFADESLSFVYSYASICHMTKSDVAITLGEIVRVLRRGGLCFVSFCASHDRLVAGGHSEAPGEYAYEENGEAGVHSIFAEAETDSLFQSLEVIQKEKRRIERFAEQPAHGWAELLYFAKKR
jgi:SAM-dependent methyltransferase